LLGVTHIQPAAASASNNGVSPAAFINPDGTLDLSGSFRGSFDLSGWDVSLDPSRGPVFLPIADEGQWESLGAGSGAVTGTVHAVAVDGSDVFVGGEFVNVDNIPEADFIAHWDGNAWHAVGNEGSGVSSLTGWVYAIKVYSPGVIYVGGWFADVNNNGVGIPEADNIARWDGTAWSALGSDGAGNGALNEKVRAIAIDGTDLYVGGGFTNAGGIATTDAIARYDVENEQWNTMGNNGAGNGSIVGQVHAIAVSDTGVYVGGSFQDVNNNGTPVTEADYIVKWNWGSSSWSALGNNGSGNGSLTGTVYAIAIQGAGALTKVYAGGAFTAVYNGTNVAIPGLQYIAFFDGSDWGEITAYPSPNAAVRSILFTGTDMYVGGDFTNMAGVGAADYVARYNFAAFTWNALENNGIAGNGSLNLPVHALAFGNSRLYVGGDFYNVNNNGSTLPAASGIASWVSASGWSALGGQSGAINNVVVAIAVNGDDVYIGGSFYNFQNNGAPVDAADYIAKWNGANWSAVGGDGSGNSSLNGQVNAIAISGSDVYVGGLFSNVNDGGTVIPEADYIAKWDGTNWSAVGSSAALNNAVWDIKIASNGDLYAGGYFTDADGIPEADKIARFDGASWHALGNNGAGNGSLNSTVFAIALQGTDVYAGGGFTNVKDGATTINQADYIAKWDGTHWSALGSNGAGNGALNQAALALAVSGTTVYAGGNFTNAAGIPNADYFAAWDGSAWADVMGTVGAGNPAFNAPVNKILTFNDHVYVGGNFTNAAGIAAGDYIARWNGTNWHAMKSDNAGNGSLNGHVTALAVGVSDIFIGGNFTDVKTNNVTLTLADYLAVYGADIPPTVVSIVRASPNPTSALNADFTVTFSEPVTGVELTDFTLTTTGVSGSTLSGLSGSDSSYTVTVKPGTGTGTVRLDIKETGTQIKDALGHPVRGGYTSGQVYNVKKSTTFKSDGANDGWVLESTEASGVGGTMNSADSAFNLGDNNLRKQYRAVLHFDTSSLPDNAVITKATLKIKKQGQVGGNPFTLLGGLLVDMRKPSFGALTLGLTDFQSAAGRTAVATFGTTSVANWYSALLNVSGKNYVNKTGTTQFRLRFQLDDNNNAIADTMKFFSGNAATGSRPQLIVEYYVP
jgi:hypothetical protein